MLSLDPDQGSVSSVNPCLGLVDLDMGPASPVARSGGTLDLVSLVDHRIQ